MSTAETALRTLLLAAPAVTALVAQRVKADRAEQSDPLPFAVYTRTGTEPFTTIDGATLGARVALELQCWADSRSQADALADACEAAIRAGGQLVTGRAATTDTELDLQATVLAVEWFEIT